MSKEKFISKEDRDVIKKARKIMQRVTRRCRQLEAIRSANDKRWPKASEELYSLLDELDKAGLEVGGINDYRVFLAYEKGAGMN